MPDVQAASTNIEELRLNHGLCLTCARAEQRARRERRRRVRVWAVATDSLRVLPSVQENLPAPTPELCYVDDSEAKQFAKVHSLLFITRSSALSSLLFSA